MARNRLTELEGGPDLGHERFLGHLRRTHQREMRRDPGRQGIVSGADTFDPLPVGAR